MALGRIGVVALLAAGALGLAGCGGGGSGGSASGAASHAAIAAPDAARFLQQASYGATDADISAVQNQGYPAWIDAQVATPQASALAYVDQRLTQLQAANPKAGLSSSQLYEFFWKEAAAGDDQLRARVKLALSEIFVVSFQDPDLDVRGMASYWDMLGTDAFGNYRTLLEDVTHHPMMGQYLTSLGNQKENLATGQHPDENYAREVMQLMSIGLYQLNPDGTQKLDASGAPIPTYSAADISGLAKVFTGMSWYSPKPTNSTFFGGNKDPSATIKPMIFYDQFHSTSEKDFLGVVIPASTTANTAADVKTALDTIFNHPNVGPFIGRRLIQSLVTSNPSPAYVGRVAAVFNDNGAGVRGDMAAVVKAVLTDTEARDGAAAAASPTYGKLREPVARMANWMRTFGATSQTGTWPVGSTSNPTSLNQSMLTAPSVFNFWRPGYVPPNSKMGAAGEVAPEFQAVDEVTVAGYLNTLQGAIERGIGPTPTGGTGPDIQSAYAKEIAVATDAGALADRLNTLLFSGTMSASLRGQIAAAAGAVAIPGGTATQTQINAALLQRVKLAVFMAMGSGEYLAQR